MGQINSQDTHLGLNPVVLLKNKKQDKQNIPEGKTLCASLNAPFTSAIITIA